MAKYKRFRTRSRAVGKAIQKYTKGTSYEGWGSTAKKALSMATKAVGMGSALYGLLNPEFKMKEVYSSATVNTTPTISLLNGLTKGDDIGNRDGRSILMKSLNLQATIIVNASTTIGSFVRCMVFIDKSPSGVSPTYTEILDTSTITQPILAQRNLNFRKRFVILRDQLIEVSPGSGGKGLYCFNYYKKLAMHTIYDASDAGDITDISNNALYFLTVSNEGVNTPTVTLCSRVRFLDN